MLGKSQYSIIVCGGVFGAEEALLQVAEMLQAPVIMSRNGWGAISTRHYLGLSEASGYHVWAKAEALLAVGTRLNMQYKNWVRHR